MRFTRLAAAFCGVAMVSGSAEAALTFSLERVPSNAGAVGPSTVLLVARDPDATGPVNIAGISGTWTDQTTSNGLKFVTDPDSGDLDFQGGVGSAGVSTRRPLVMGTFLDIPSRTVQIITGVASDGSAVETSNDPKIAQGLKQASLISSRTNNLSISAATLTSTGGAVLGAAVVSSPDDVVTLTKASYGAVDASGNALPDQTIPDLSTGAPVPEPTALGLAGVAVVGLARRRRKA